MEVTCQCQYAQRTSDIFGLGSANKAIKLSMFDNKRLDDIEKYFVFNSAEKRCKGILLKCIVRQKNPQESLKL